jgi:hypothetical protein
MPPNRFVPASEIVRRLKLSMPVHLDGLVDPLGNEFSIHRENLMELLTTDIDALPFDNQSVSPLYMEMARAQRACEWGADQLDTRYVRWKAQKAAEFRDAAEKKPTVAEVEGFYRQHDEYVEMVDAPKSLRVLSNLFADAKNAFLMKARAQEHQSKLMAGHESSIRYDDQQQRLTELEELDQATAEAIQQSGSAKAAADYVRSLKGE